MKKFAALAMLFAIFWGCEVSEDTGGPCPEVPAFFNINGLTVSNRMFETYCCGDIIPNNERISFESHSIFGNYDFTLHAHVPIKGGFLSRSYALSCLAGGYEGSRERIDAFVVTTNYDINENYLAGDTINDLLVYNDFFTEWTLNEYLNDEERAIPNDKFFLRLIEKPIASDTASFNVTIILDNGESYSETTQNVIFEP